MPPGRKGGGFHSLAATQKQNAELLAALRSPREGAASSPVGSAPGGEEKPPGAYAVLGVFYPGNRFYRDDFWRKLTRPAGLSNPSPVQKQVLNRLTVFIDVNRRKY
ncbi:hypothetical protein DQK32_23615 [Salmonella enterica subsp. enterica serovar Newport]|uniref:Uncharacterized protein n=1 Tax=Salmonella newport TaxID=108619 RepID=A0A5U9VT39_SALNE|nr:hypothetical protein [Salmonella enterica subsp. enterica serovar Newport]